MQQYLYKYLLLHHKLSIPALGSFMVEFQPAEYNESTGLLFPRKPVINFNEGAAATADRGLVHFLAEEMETDEITAGKEFQTFSIKLLVNMVEQHFIDLPGIGRIKKEMNGNIVFTPASNLIDILPPLRLDEKIRAKKAIQKTYKEPTGVTPTPTAVPIAATGSLQTEVLKANRPQPDAGPVKHLSEKETAELLSIIRDERKPTAKVVEMSRTTVEEEEEVVVKDRWWIYAAVLAVAGVLALLVRVL